MSDSKIDRSEFRRGFAAMVPLWLGVVPFAAAYAILARTNSFSVVETVAMSVVVFAGSAQLAIVDLAGNGSSEAAILLTVLLLNLRHILYGLSLNHLLPIRTQPPRPILATAMTDEAYGITIRDFRAGRGSAAFLFGGSTSLFASFTVATILGALLGGYLPNPDRLGLSVIFPLSFLALLLALLRTRVDFLVASVAAIVALGLHGVVDGGVLILIVTIFGAGLGAFVDRKPSAEFS